MMAEVVALFEDVSKINSKESSSKLKEFFIENLDRGTEVKKNNLFHTKICPPTYLASGTGLL